MSIIDLPPKDQQRWSHFMQKWKLTVDPLHIDHQSPPRINRGNRLFNAKVKVDCWSSQHQSSIPPGSTEAIACSCKSESWLLILSTLIIDPPQDQQRRLPFHAKVKETIASLCWSLIASASTIDPPTFLIFNIRIWVGSQLVSICESCSRDLMRSFTTCLKRLNTVNCVDS